MARWRYKLPCGHHNYSARAMGERNRSINDHYYCKQCGGRFDFKIDKKTGEKVRA